MIIIMLMSSPQMPITDADGECLDVVREPEWSEMHSGNQLLLKPDGVEVFVEGAIR